MVFSHCMVFLSCFLLCSLFLPHCNAVQNHEPLHEQHSGIRILYVPSAGTSPVGCWGVPKPVGAILVAAPRAMLN